VPHGARGRVVPHQNLPRTPEREAAADRGVTQRIAGPDGVDTFHESVVELVASATNG